MRRNQDIIFYNYGKYLYENKSKFKDASSTIEMLASDDEYNKFINAMLEGFSEEQITGLKPILECQRETVLEESANIATSQIASGYAISYFPILSDIYMDDILFKAVTHHITKEPILTFPKMQLQANVKNSDGSSLQLPFPRARYLIRTKPEEFSLLPDRANNLFVLSNCYPNEVNDKLSFVNKRYFILQNITIQITDSTSNVTNQIVDLGLRPDARGQTNKKFEFVHNGHIVVGSIVGNINWDKGIFVYSVTFANGLTDYQYVAKELDVSVLFTARTGDIGRVKITLSMDGWDVNVDVKEDFEFDLNVEMLQEYNDIYNFDMIKTISDAIKAQVLLNRDHDISHLLTSAEPTMKTLNTFETVDFQQYRDMSNIISPSFIGAVFQTVAPRLSIVNRYIWMNMNVVPQYILTGIRAAAALEQLQEFAVTLPTYRNGLVGFDNLHAMNIHVNVFLKSIILSSPALPDDKMYIVYKPDEQIIQQNVNPEIAKMQTKEKLRTTVLANIIYKPLYIVEEITNSEKRHFIRSRTALELFRPEGLGCIHLIGFKELLSNQEVGLSPII